MKQVVQDLQGGGTKIVDVPVPAVGPGEVLVRTAFSLLSAGTERMVAEFAGKSLVGKARARPDLVRQTIDKARREGPLAAVDAVRSRMAEPMALGYSSAGTVIGVGPGVDDLRPGDRVACAGGGYAVHAEVVAVPRLLVAKLPDDVALEAGAFVTLGAIALHGIRLAQIQVGERVGVIGLGLVGLLAVAIARSAGAQVFGIDLDVDRAGLADRMGGRGIARDGAEAALGATSDGMDAVLICADTESNDPVELAAAIARDRARIVAVGAVGMELPRKAYYEKELTFLISRSYGPGRYDPDYEEKGHDYPAGYVRWTEGRNLQAVVDLMGRGAVDVHPLIDHRVSIDRAAEAYDLIRGRALSVLIDYTKSRVEPERGRVVTLREAVSARPGTVRLGVLGAGRFAQGVVLPALKNDPRVDLVAVASERGLSAAEAARRYGFRYATTDVERVVQDPDVDAVAVLTRHHLHAAQTSAALRAGKHVWCEKPLALDPQGLEEVEEALKGAPGRLTVGFNRRRAPLFLRLQGFLGLQAGPLTMIYRVHAGPLPPDHWLLDPEQGGGRLIGEVCHFIDALVALAGTPRRIQATGTDPGEVTLAMEFDGGSQGTIVYTARGDRSFSKERLEVFAAGRVAVLDDFRRLEMIADGRRMTARHWLRADKGHAALWKAFVDAIVEGGDVPIPYADLFAVSAATLAAADSLRRRSGIDLESPPFTG
ncbi:MAG TPA: bi-domain-containing oxidoreductase [Anaerolineales bacterium]|nr:bi-domain-containing oxidoreductase [Anaerolineales bacterium]